MQKILNLIRIVFVIGILLSIPAPLSYAAQEQPADAVTGEGQDNGFIIENGILVKYTGTAEDVIVPDGITAIGGYAFNQNNNLISVTLPDSVAEIGDGAFVECGNLKRIYFSNRLTRIGNMAFYNCGSLEDAAFPESLNIIGEEAFGGCWNLSAIVIPGNVREIGLSAFSKCMKASCIVISEGVENISAGVFYRCLNVRTVVLPASITYIVDGEFETIGDFTLYGVEGSYAQSYAKENGFKFTARQESSPEMFDIRDGVLVGYSGNATDVVIPKGVKSIGEAVFADSTYAEDNVVGERDNLLSVTIPEGVTEIGTNAFLGCRNLMDIAIPSSVSRIGATSFWKTLWLKRKSAENPLVIVNGILADGDKCRGIVTIPEGVTAISEAAFSANKNITGIFLPSSVRTIGGLAFSGCKNLISASIPSSVDGIGKNAFNNVSEDFILMVEEGSYAENYARENNVSYSYEPAGGNPSCSHTLSASVVPATMKKDGTTAYICTRCGAKSVMPIYAPETVQISESSFIYNGKTCKPSITIKDSKDKLLRNKTDYTISYPKAMKNVGTYTVTIKFKGNYRGTVKKTFTIVPKGTSISKITPGKKGFTVKWKKQTTDYEIAYSTDSKFTKKNTKIIPVSKNKTTLKLVNRLKAKKKYYVRIRTCKTVKGKKYYSDWSKIKIVTTRK